MKLSSASLEHVLFVVELFSTYSIEELGFLALSFETICADLETPSTFSLSFNKVKGEGVLFGEVHVLLRRHIVNGLSLPERLSLLLPKLRYSGLFLTEHVPLHETLLLEDRIAAIEDIVDIGMGHSLYKFLSEGQWWVLKKRDVSHQTFYTALLAHIGWASYRSYSFKNDKGFWDVSDFLEGPTVSEFLMQDPTPSDALIQELARHAALGDLLGRGDRHGDNYIFHEGALLPIDVSYLFWEDNEDWVCRYLASCMAEYSWLFLDSPSSSVATSRSTLFFETYYQSLQQFLFKKDMLETFIRGYYEPSLETDRKVSFLVSRLDSLESYFAFQKERYEDAILEMYRRQSYKLKLQDAVYTSDEVLEDPLLKMYFLADFSRMSAFFLLSDLQRDFVLERF